MKVKDIEKRGLYPLDGWRAAELLGLTGPTEGYRALARAGWVYVGYDWDGQELWAPKPMRLTNMNAYSR